MSHILSRFYPDIANFFAASGDDIPILMRSQASLLLICCYSSFSLVFFSILTSALPLHHVIGKMKLLLHALCLPVVPALLSLLFRAGTEGYILISRGPNIPLRSPYTVTLFASITPKIQ
jgi:hypothetical protein